MQDILRQVQSLGISITFQGDNLVCTPGSKLTPELRQAIRQHKAELVEWLSSDDQQALFDYLMESIHTGGPYSRLWPRVRTYCKRHLTDGQWKTVEAAYELNGKE